MSFGLFSHCSFYLPLWPRTRFLNLFREVKMIVSKNEEGLFVATNNGQRGEVLAGFAKNRIQAMMFCAELLLAVNTKQK